MRVRVHCTFVQEPCVKTMNHSTSNYEVIGKYTRCSIIQLHQHYFLKYKYIYIYIYIYIPYDVSKFILRRVLYTHKWGSVTIVQ